MGARACSSRDQAVRPRDDCNGHVVPKHFVGDGECDNRRRKYSEHYRPPLREVRYDNADCGALGRREGRRRLRVVLHELRAHLGRGVSARACATAASTTAAGTFRRAAAPRALLADEPEYHYDFARRLQSDDATPAPMPTTPMPTGVSERLLDQIEPIGCESSTECYGQDCDFWVGYGYTCAQLEDYYDCDCGHCLCGETAEDEATCGTCSDINWEASIAPNCAADITLDLVRVSPADLRLCPLWVTIDTSHFLDADTESSVTMTLTGKRGKHSAMTSTRVVASSLVVASATSVRRVGRAPRTSRGRHRGRHRRRGSRARSSCATTPTRPRTATSARRGALARHRGMCSASQRPNGRGQRVDVRGPAEGWRRKSFDVLKSSIAQAEEDVGGEVAAIDRL